MHSTSTLQTVVFYVHQHPGIGWFVAFLAAFIEALAIVGSLVPGSVTMTAVGLLAGTAVMSLWTALAWSTLGALTGDVLSYWIGHHFKERLLTIWPISKFPQWIEKSKHFIREHGKKSVVIGRFIAPMRSMVPMIAGMLDMPIPTFMLAALISALLWSFVYLIPGFLLGALSVELPAGAATELILLGLSIIVAAWLISWTTKLVYTSFSARFKLAMILKWKALEENHSMLRKIFTPNHNPLEYRPLVYLVLFSILIILFGVTTYQVITQTGLYTLNTPIYLLMRDLHNDVLTKASILISIFGGENHALALVELVIISWCLARKQWWLALCFFFIAGTSGSSIMILKHFIASQRPDGLVKQKSSFSFPSGHTTAVCSYVAFTFITAATQIKQEKRWISYSIAAILIFITAFSRIYLTAHWFTDILGGLTLGLSILCLTLGIMYRGPKIKFNPYEFIVVAITTWLLICGIYTYKNFDKMHNNYQLTWPETELTMKYWWKFGTTKESQASSAPTFRVNPTGNPVMPFNFQYVGNLNELESKLNSLGWIEIPTNGNWKNMIKRYVIHRKNHRLPVFPQMHQNNSPTLMMTKKGEGQAPALIIRIWPTNAIISGSNKKFWLGNVEIFKAPYHHWISKERDRQLTAIKILQRDLKPYKTNIVSTKNKQSTVRWDGKQLLSIGARNAS